MMGGLERTKKPGVSCRPHQPDTESPLAELENDETAAKERRNHAAARCKLMGRKELAATGGYRAGPDSVDLPSLTAYDANRTPSSVSTGIPRSDLWATLPLGAS